MAAAGKGDPDERARSRKSEVSVAKGVLSNEKWLRRVMKMLFAKVSPSNLVADRTLSLSLSVSLLVSSMTAHRLIVLWMIL